MSLLTTVINLKGKEFDIHRNLFPPIEGSTVYLLQEDGALVNYKKTNTHAGLTSSWRLVTNKYLGTKDIEIATTEANFYDVISRSTHLAIGTPSSAIVYKIVDGSIDPPNEKYPYYTVSITKNGETFLP